MITVLHVLILCNDLVMSLIISRQIIINLGMCISLLCMFSYCLSLMITNLQVYIHHNNERSMMCMLT